MRGGGVGSYTGAAGDIGGEGQEITVGPWGRRRCAGGTNDFPFCGDGVSIFGLIRTGLSTLKANDIGAGIVKNRVVPICSMIHRHQSHALSEGGFVSADTVLG